MALAISKSSVMHRGNEIGEGVERKKFVRCGPQGGPRAEMVSVSFTPRTTISRTRSISLVLGG